MIGIERHFGSMPWFWSALIGIDRHWAMIEGVLNTTCLYIFLSEKIALNSAKQVKVVYQGEYLLCNFEACLQREEGKCPVKQKLESCATTGLDNPIKTGVWQGMCVNYGGSRSKFVKYGGKFVKLLNSTMGCPGKPTFENMCRRQSTILCQCHTKKKLLFVWHCQRYWAHKVQFAFD